MTKTTTPSEIAELPVAAIEQLRDHQRQLDEDGTFVGVSRQAIDEVLTYITALRPPTTDNSELIEPDMSGSFVGDIWFGDPVKRILGTHRWDGAKWERLPGEMEGVLNLLAAARTRIAALEASIPHDAWRAGVEAAAKVAEHHDGYSCVCGPIIAAAIRALKQGD